VGKSGMLEHKSGNITETGALKMQDMKLTDQFAGHEIAGHENAGMK